MGIPSWMAIGVIGLFATAFAAEPATGPSSAPATGGATNIRALRAEAQKTLDAMTASLPTLGERTMDQVMRMSIERDDLVLRTRLPATVGEMRVDIPGIGGISSVSIQGLLNANPPQTPIFLQFSNRDVTRPDALIVQTQIFARPGYMQVARDVETLETEQSLSLIQWRINDGEPGEDPGVRLRVRSLDKASGENLVNLNLTADTLVELRRRFPRETSTWLQPVFRDLHQEQVFSVDPKLAWQVFANDRRIDPALVAKASELVKTLNADDAAVRESAQQSLAALGQDGATALMKMDRAGWTPEQHASVDALLESYRPITDEEAERLRTQASFLIDCLYCDDPAIRTAALGHLQHVVGRKIAFDNQAGEVERLAAIASLRAGILSASDKSPATAPQ